MNIRDTCYVIILNYRSWKDTIECLDSVFQSENVKYKIIVCDNDSQNESLEHIIDWLENKISIVDIFDNMLLKKHLTDKPSYIYWSVPKFETYESNLLLVQNTENKGFAAGNNVALKIAALQKDCKYMYILNNDTVIMPDTLSKVMEAMNANPCNGICSSRIKEYYAPNHDGWLKRSFIPSKGIEVLADDDQENQEYLYKYTGMAFLIKKEILDKIGYMNEEYFLYFEELDWTYKIKEFYKKTISNDAIVYHKEGQSAPYTSMLSKFCTLRSRFLFIDKYYHHNIYKIYILWWLRLLKKIFIGEYSEAIMMFKFLVMFPLKKERYHGGFF